MLGISSSSVLIEMKINWYLDLALLLEEFQFSEMMYRVSII